MESRINFTEKVYEKIRDNKSNVIQKYANTLGFDIVCETCIIKEKRGDNDLTLEEFIQKLEDDKELNEGLKKYIEKENRKIIETMAKEEGRDIMGDICNLTGGCI